MTAISIKVPKKDILSSNHGKWFTHDGHTYLYADSCFHIKLGETSYYIAFGKCQADDDKRLKSIFSKELAPKPEKKKKGFAAMDPDKHRKIAEKGGLSHTKEHFKIIGKKGGDISGANRSRKSKHKPK